MRFHHVIAAIIILAIGLAYTLLLADQVARLSLDRATSLPVWERQP